MQTRIVKREYRLILPFFMKRIFQVIGCYYLLSSSGPGCEFPFGLFVGENASTVMVRLLENALTTTKPIINRIASPETTKSGSNQPGGWRAPEGVEAPGIGVVTIAAAAGTSVPTAE